MPFVDMPYSKRLSDLVVHEIDPSVGYGRKCVNVTPLPIVTGKQRGRTGAWSTAYLRKAN